MLTKKMSCNHVVVWRDIIYNFYHMGSPNISSILQTFSVQWFYPGMGKINNHNVLAHYTNIDHKWMNLVDGNSAALIMSATKGIIVVGGLKEVLKI